MSHRILAGSADARPLTQENTQQNNATAPENGALSASAQRGPVDSLNQAEPVEARSALAEAGSTQEPTPQSWVSASTISLNGTCLSETSSDYLRALVRDAGGAEDLVRLLGPFSKNAQQQSGYADPYDTDTELEAAVLQAGHYPWHAGRLAQELGIGAGASAQNRPRRWARLAATLPTPEALHESMEAMWGHDHFWAELSEILQQTDSFQFAHDNLLEMLHLDGWRQQESDAEIHKGEKFDAGSRSSTALFAAHMMQTAMLHGQDRDRLLILDALCNRLNGENAKETAAAVARVLGLQIKPSALERALSGDVSLVDDPSPEFAVSTPSGSFEAAFARAQTEAEVDERRIANRIRREIKNSPLAARFINTIAGALEMKASNAEIAEILAEFAALTFRGGALYGADMAELGQWGDYGAVDSGVDQPSRIDELVDLLQRKLGYGLLSPQDVARTGYWSESDFWAALRIVRLRTAPEEYGPVYKRVDEGVDLNEAYDRIYPNDGGAQ